MKVTYKRDFNRRERDLISDMLGLTTRANDEVVRRWVEGVVQANLHYQVTKKSFGTPCVNGKKAGFSHRFRQLRASFFLKQVLDTF